MKTMAFLPTGGVLATLSLVLLLSACSEQPKDNPEIQFSAAMLKEEYKDSKRIKKRDEKGIKYAAYWMEAMKVNPETGVLDVKDIYKARFQAQRLRNAGANKQGALNLAFENLGPDNVGGRTRGFMIDRNNTNHLFVGGVTGGIFVSEDGGLNWTEHPDNGLFLSTSISSIIQAANGDIYVGTGETFVFTQQNNVGHIGGGIYKSTDNGVSFSLLTSTTPDPNNPSDTWAYVSELAADPFNGSRIYAATRTGLFVTNDGGATWTGVQGVANADNGREARDVQVNKAGVVFAEINKKYYRSADGQTFQLISGTGGFPSTNVLRIEFAPSPEDENYVYAAIANNNDGLRGIYRSIDGGINWTPYSQENSSVFNPLGSQGEYDLAFAVNPANKDEVVIGGQLELWKGGLNVGWNMIAYWTPESPTNPYYVHADMHSIHFDPTNPKIMYVTSDGGVSKSVNADQQFPTFTPRNKNYVTTQFYHMAASRSGEVMAGAQDNGTVYINYRGNTVFSGLDVRGGDGGYCAISQLNPDIIFSEIQFGALSRSLNRGSGFGSMWDDYALGLGAGSQGFSQFIAPYDLWEKQDVVIDSIVTDSVTLAQDTFTSLANRGYLVFGALGRIMYTPDALDAGAVYWYSANVSGAVSAVSATPDGNFYIGTSSGNLYYVSGFTTATYNRNNNTASGINVRQLRNSSSWAGTSARYITSVGVDPKNSAHIVVTLGGYGTNINVFESDDALVNNPVFTGIQGNLPNMPVYGAVIDYYNADNIILGTDLGVWSSADGGANWSQEFNGIYNTPIYSIEQQGLYNDDCHVIYVSTYGRGMFRSTTLTELNNPSCNLASGVIESKPVTLNKLTLYPNPISNEMYLDLTLAKAGNVTVSIIDITGREVMRKNHGNLPLGSNKLAHNLSNLQTGVYVVAVQTPLGLDTRQIVVTR